MVENSNGRCGDKKVKFECEEGMTEEEVDKVVMNVLQERQKTWKLDEVEWGKHPEDFD